MSTDLFTHAKLIVFLFQQQRQENASLWIDALPGNSHFEIILRSEGFVLTSVTKAKLHQINFGYTEILNSPELINCYAAKKITFKLHGSISFTIVERAQLISLSFFRSSPRSVEI